MKMISIYGIILRVIVKNAVSVRLKNWREIVMYPEPRYFVLPKNYQWRDFPS